MYNYAVPDEQAPQTQPSNLPDSPPKNYLEANLKLGKQYGNNICGHFIYVVTQNPKCMI